jgi:hypothetical protein
VEKYLLITNTEIQREMGTNNRTSEFGFSGIRGTIEQHQSDTRRNNQKGTDIQVNFFEKEDFKSTIR